MNHKNKFLLNTQTVRLSNTHGTAQIRMCKEFGKIGRTRNAIRVMDADKIAKQE
jgi:hypothetical protein